MKGYLDPIDATFAGYTGRKLYSVMHPRHGCLKIAAPDEAAAIVAAAKQWKERWHAYDFYTSCTVMRLKKADRLEHE